MWTTSSTLNQKLTFITRAAQSILYSRASLTGCSCRPKNSLASTTRYFFCRKPRSKTFQNNPILTFFLIVEFLLIQRYLTQITSANKKWKLSKKSKKSAQRPEKRKQVTLWSTCQVRSTLKMYGQWTWGITNSMTRYNVLNVWKTRTDTQAHATAQELGSRMTTPTSMSTSYTSKKRKAKKTRLWTKWLTLFWDTQGKMFSTWVGWYRQT